MMPLRLLLHRRILRRRFGLRRCGLAPGSLLPGLLAFALATAALRASDSPPPLIPPGAQSGDLIFRKGTEAVSELVRTIDGGEFTHVGILIAASDLSPEHRAGIGKSVAASRHRQSVEHSSKNGGGSEAAAAAGKISHEHPARRPEADSSRAADNTGPSTDSISDPDAWFVLHATPSEVKGRPDSVVLDSLDFFTSPHLSKDYVVYHIADADELQRRAAVTAALTRLGLPFSLTEADGVYCTELPYAAWLSAGVDLEVRFRRLAIFLFAPREFLLPSALMASPKLHLLRND